jgi:hypothetical protein
MNTIHGVRPELHSTGPAQAPSVSLTARVRRAKATHRPMRRARGGHGYSETHAQTRRRFTMVRSMRNAALRALVPIVGCLFAVGLAACGGGAASSSATQAHNDPAVPLSGNVVAQVGGTVITKAMLGHEMSTIFGGDYYEINRHPAPRALVSEPPNYPACLAELRALVRRMPAGSRPGVAQLGLKCQQVYQAIKVQALGVLLADQWYKGLDAEQGVTVSEAEAEHALAQLKASQFPKEGEFQAYIAHRHWTVADELLLLTIDLLSTKIQEKIKTSGAQVSEALNQSTTKWTAQTRCRTGYVVERCKQYKGPSGSPSTPSPALLVEQLNTLG